MGLKDCLLLLLCTITLVGHAQNSDRSSLNIGDSAPTLHVQEWIKGTPIQQFEKGQIYVLEFWATWCKPCIAAMPHLSNLATKHKDHLKIIGVNIYEDEDTATKQIRAFVEGMGDRMNYHVVIDDDNRMADGWMGATGEKDNGIPRTFVINTEGRLAWIGHPKDLDTVLAKMLDNKWNIDAALKKRNEQKHLDSLINATTYSLLYYSMDLSKSNLNEVDNARLVLEKTKEIVENEPKLENTYPISYYTFSSLLKIDQKKAYDYGKRILTPANEHSSQHYPIIEVVRQYSDELDLLPEIYHLGAEAYQEEINQIVYPEITDMYKYYIRMANWYFRANDKSKAITAQQKAIEALKDKDDFSTADLDALESQLQQYQEMENIK